jgi:hypothetical protein
MKSTVRVNRVIAIVMIAVALFVAFGTQNIARAQEATVKATGTVEKNAEFIAEAYAEKTFAAESTQVEAEPVVEGATGTEEAEATIEYVAEPVEEVVESRPEVREEVVIETKAVETEATQETIAYDLSSMAAEAVENEYDETVAELASTDTAPATNVKAETIDAAATETLEDDFEVSFAAAESNYTAANVNATGLSIAGKEVRDFVVIGDDTLRYSLQKTIDAGNIVCYPSCDMTQGVKYFAGHNPGAMSHVNTAKVGAIFRLSNGERYQDYKIVEIVQGAGSFTDIKFKKAGTDLWTMLKTWNQNAVVVQFCRNGINTFHYAVAI